MCMQLIVQEAGGAGRDGRAQLLSLERTSVHGDVVVNVWGRKRIKPSFVPGHVRDRTDPSQKSITGGLYVFLCNVYFGRHGKKIGEDKFMQNILFFF